MSNEKNLTPELLEKAKSATSAAALLALAQENGITLTAEEATAYYTQLHPKEGALSDEELDNVSGGCSDTNEKLAIDYAMANYCGKNQRCAAYQAKTAKKRGYYMSLPKGLGMLCYNCGCEALINADCRSMGWTILGTLTRKYDIS